MEVVMNRKTLYWIIGIIAIVIIGLILWGSFGRNRTNQDHSNHSAPPTESTPAPTTNPTDTTVLSAYLEEQDELMEDMMDDMEDISPEGYAALDFLNGMIPHHEAAVLMSESYLKYGGSNEELKTLAEDIIQVQKQEITEMQAMAKEIKSAGTQDPQREEAYLKEYSKMFTNHQMDHSNHSTPASVEAAFAEGMIMHHQMAVEMAQAILSHTDEEKVIALANNIIETQNKEIEQMQEILDNINS